MRKFLQMHWRAVAAALALAASGATGHAQGYPDRPITVKIGFPAGGPADASIRAAAVVFQRSLSQTLILENNPGANGSLAAMNVLNAVPDGYTLLGTTGTDFLLAPLSMASAKYTHDKFKLLGVVGISDFLLVSSPAHAFRTPKELLAAARAAKEPLSIGHWGPGSTPHIAAAAFQSQLGIKFTEIPYKGAAPAITAVGGSQVDLSFVPLGGNVLGLIQTGRMKPIALAAAKRNPALPNVPTISESLGLPGFEFSVWSGLFAPKATPEPVVKLLTNVMNRWIDSPENLERIATNASRRLDPMTPAQAETFLDDEHRKLTGIAKTLNLELN